MGIVAAVADELAVVSLVEEVAGFLPSFDVGFEDKAVFIKLDGPTRRRTEDRRTVPQDMGQPLDDASAGSQHDSRGIGQLDQWFNKSVEMRHPHRRVELDDEGRVVAVNDQARQPIVLAMDQSIPRGVGVVV